MRRVVFLILVFAVACGGAGAKSPDGSGSALPPAFAEAFKEEAIGRPETAAQRYFDALRAAAEEDVPYSLETANAALDALVHRSLHSFEEATNDAAIAYRLADARAANRSFQEQLSRIHEKAGSPWVASAVARALEELNAHVGDARGAETWRARRGCAREARVVGPIDWTTVTALDEPGPLDAADAPLKTSYAAPGPFGSALPTVFVRGNGCDIDVTGASSSHGVRYAVVDAEVPKAGWLSIVLRSRVPAALMVGGLRVASRSYDAGPGDAAQFARVHVTAGTLRIAAKVGLNADDESVNIEVLDDRGGPIKMHAPAIDSKANARADRFAPRQLPVARTTAEQLVLASADLARGDARAAERRLQFVTTAKDPAPELLLVYGRSVAAARDLSRVHRAERARSAYERVLKKWPGSWEAALEQAVLAGARRGRNEARIEMLEQLEKARTSLAESRAGLADAFDALMSGQERLFDRARTKLSRSRSEQMAGAALLDDIARVIDPRGGRELAQFECDQSRANRGTARCYQALRSLGDWPGAAREIDRLRALHGAPDGYVLTSLRDALITGDRKLAASWFSKLAPGERTLSTLFDIKTGEAPDAVAKAIRELAPIARDAPAALLSLTRVLGNDPIAEFGATAEKLAAEDRAHPMMPGAATAVLTHTERYEIDANGLTHYVLFDLRRVSGTTDVEENAQADAPNILGRNSSRAVRRRIFKKDGRILAPERTPNAAQAHADLSQLEEGDIVEAIYEGFTLPSETGDIGIDTPDLLPDRVAVREATIELRFPNSPRALLWAHPLLGKAVEKKEGATRTLRYSVTNATARRLEEGVAKMDREVGVSFSTATYDDVARALRETEASLNDHDPEIAQFAMDAAKGKTGREAIDSVVRAVGEAVRMAQPAALSDMAIGPFTGAQSNTARTILAEHEGSRSWLVTRALRELRIPANIVVAETQPFSADPAFPPHFGRFLHPLVVARVANQDVWIDADVAGPPLPVGRISPELRGRTAIRNDGKIFPIQSSDDDSDRDEIDLRLVVAANGDADGDFTILLRGRDAQELAELFIRVVGAERQRILRAIVLAWVPFATVDDVTLSSTEGSWQVAVRAKLQVVGYAQRLGNADDERVLPGIDPIHFIAARSYSSTLRGTFASQGTRQSALAINQAVQYHLHRVVEVPNGWRIVKVPGPFVLQRFGISGSRKSEIAGTRLEDDFSLRVTTGTVPIQEYGAFLEEAQRLDDAFRSGVFARRGADLAAEKR